MARPLKDGVDYFPKDTGFYEDDKIRLLRVEFGAKGMYLLDYLLCDLYGKNGYYFGIPGRNFSAGGGGVKGGICENSGKCRRT